MQSNKLVVIVSIILVIVQIACSTSGVRTNDEVETAPNKDTVKTHVGVSSETAVLIAKGYMGFDYDLRNRDFVVETESQLWKENGEMWKVTLVRKEHRDTYGGDPIVWILKENGEVYTVEHRK